MNIEKKLIFGMDGSDFCERALERTGNLLKNCEHIGITLFNGAPAPYNFSFVRSAGELAEFLQKYHDVMVLESRKILDKSKEVLLQSGFNPDRISTILNEQCYDPADTLLKLAGSEGMDTIAVGRWGKASLSRQLMGSVTYKLVKMADSLACWAIDPRIGSQDVLVGLVDAPVSTRLLDYTVRYFSHLKESRFTLFHVIPPVRPHYWESHSIFSARDHGDQKKLESKINEQTDRIRQIALQGKEKLIQAGVPKINITVKVQPQNHGIARDVLLELREKNHGILIIGRKGSKNIKDFSLGSKSNKLLLTAQAFLVCLVS